MRFLSRGSKPAWLDLTRTTVDTTIELPLLRHDFTLLCCISLLLLHCVFLLLRCGTSLFHSRVLFVHRRWVILTHRRHSLFLLLRVTRVFGTMVEFFSGSVSTFLVLRSKRWRWFFFENSTTSITSTTCNKSLSKSNIIKNILFMYLIHADEKD